MTDAWKRPDSWKAPENVTKLAADLKAKLEEIRPNFAARGPFGPAPSPEELKDQLAKPEPKFQLPALTQRIGQLANGLDSFSAAPAKSQLDQIALAKKAVEDAALRIDKLLKEDVAAFNKAVNEAKAPAIHIQP